MKTAMLAFGPVRWGPSLGPVAPEPAPTPIGEKCIYCDEPIAGGDSGVIMAMVEGSPIRMRLVAEHRECLLRRLLGPVDHQLGHCTCFGGTQRDEDPPGMSLRQGARAAAAVAAENRGAIGGDELRAVMATWGVRPHGAN